MLLLEGPKTRNWHAEESLACTTGWLSLVRNDDDDKVQRAEKKKAPKGIHSLGRFRFQGSMKTNHQPLGCHLSIEIHEFVLGHWLSHLVGRWENACRCLDLGINMTVISRPFVGRNGLVMIHCDFKFRVSFQEEYESLQASSAFLSNGPAEGSNNGCPWGFRLTNVRQVLGDACFGSCIAVILNISGGFDLDNCVGN